MDNLSLLKCQAAIWKSALFLFLLIVPFYLTAQVSHPTYRHYTADDGLPSSGVFECFQDHTGYIWFATDNGVSRYNGYSFENFGALQGLTEQEVFHLTEDKKGRIWMQCMSGRMFYFENDSIHAFEGNQFVEKFKNRQDFSKGFYISPNGDIYSSILPFGIFRFTHNSKPDQLINEGFYGAFQIGNKVLPVYKIDQIAKLKSLNLVAFTLYLENGIFHHTLPVQSPGGLDFNMTLLKDQTLLVYHFGRVFCFRKGILIWNIVQDERILDWYENAKGEIFIGLANKGVRRYKNITELQAGNFYTLLEGYSIADIFEDRDGGYWFAALKNGVFYCPNPQLEIFDKTSGLPSEYISSIALKSKKELFVGFLNNGFIYMDLNANKINPVYTENTAIYDLNYDARQKTLWVCKPVIMTFQNDNWGTIKKKSASSNIGYGCKHFHFSSLSNRLWAGSFYGFFLFDQNTRKLLLKSSDLIFQNSPYKVRTNDIITSSSNQSWIGNTNGLFRLDNNQVVSTGIKDAAFNSNINSIEELPDSTLVLATRGYGLVFWKAPKIAYLTETEGLASNSIENMHIDSKQNLWVGTLNGLNKINWQWNEKYKIETITTAHGLPSNEITKVCSWGEHIWVGTTKGLAHFTTQKLNSISPKPILGKLYSNRQSINMLALRNLSYQQNNLTLNFYALNFKMNGKIPYRYRLNNGEWISTFNTSLNFPALPPGTSFFEVQAQNEDGFWSDSTSLQYTIHPPWWGTGWAKTLLALLIIAIVIGLYLFRIRFLKKNYRMKVQMAELERSALQAQMNPHFIFNSLNSIQNYILQNEKASAIKYLGTFASLVRSMLNASMAGKISLDEEIKLLNNYLELEKIRFKNRFTYEINVEEGLDRYEIMIPPLLVQPYIENAVKHGITGRESGGNIEVSFEEKDKFIEVSIIDNGSGIKAGPDDKEKLNEHKSFGMSITQNRLELLSNNNINNTVSSESLFDGNGQVSGTRIIIRIGLTEEVNS